MSCAGSLITNDQILALLFAIAPQFATTDPVKLAGYNALIDALRCMVNEKLLGCCAVLAFANLLAHYLTMQANGYLGITSSISEGQLSISLANTANGNFYGSSPYGQAYWQIIGNFKIGAYVTNSRGGWFGPTCCGSPGFGLRF
jgi:hypothetical protein